VQFKILKFPGGNKKKDRQHNDQKKKTKGQIMIYKALHGKLNIEKHEPGDDLMCS
jgi:hypothetical protein